MKDKLAQEIYDLFEVPPPTLNGLERKRRRLSWQNMYTLHKRECSATKKKILSIYHDDVPFPVYDLPYWWSDAWSAQDYAVDFDFSKSFFEQFEYLMARVPHAALVTSYETLENSSYINYASYLKNCYLVFHTTFSDDCLYCVGIKKCRDVVDCAHVYDSELCYGSVDCDRCYSVKYASNSQNCSDCLFIDRCIGCKNCIGCVNLRNQEYCIFNQKYSREEYEKKLALFNFTSREQVEKFRAKYLVFCEPFPCHSSENVFTEEVSGTWLSGCRNVYDSFSVRNARDCQNVERIYDGCENCYEVDQFGQNAELFYECECSGIDSYRLRFCAKVRNGSREVDYSMFLFGCTNCLGCIGLRKGKNCIFNKSYSVQEYDVLHAKIRAHMKESGEWGEFFPVSISPFGYNETIAHEYFPLSRSEVLSRGWKWRERESVAETSPLTAPDQIGSVDQNELRQTFSCKECRRNYRLQSPEIHFYVRQQIPPPDVCPECRRRVLLSSRGSRTVDSLACANCGNSTMTNLPVNSKRKIYCDSCWQAYSNENPI